MKLPIENLYYLLCYAWNHLETRELLRSAALKAERPEDLLARLLSEGTSHVLRAGLDRGYVERSGDLSAPRGKMDVATTGKRALLAVPAVHCRFDELSHDVPHNRVIKATLETLARSGSLAPELRGELARIAERLDTVASVPLSNQLFRKIYVHRNNAAYGLVIDVCALVARNLLPESENGGVQLRDFTGSDQQMGLMFEEFVRAFLRREQSCFKVDSRHIPWDGAGATSADDARLPIMKTDVTLSSESETVVVETKYYSDPLLQYHGGTAKVRSGHLYQLLSYVRNLSATAKAGGRVRGILLYAQAGRELDLQYRIHGHEISVKSLNLTQPWDRVRSDLLRLAEPTEAQAA